MFVVGVPSVTVEVLAETGDFAVVGIFPAVGALTADSVHHRVDRVLSFFSSRPSWDPHPLTHRRVSPAPRPPGLGGGPSLARGGGGSQFGRGDRHCGTLGTRIMYFVASLLLIAPLLLSAAAIFNVSITKLIIFHVLLQKCVS